MPKCHAHRSNGDPCGRSAMSFQDVCATHGGKSPQALASAARRAAEEAATAALADRPLWSQNAEPTTDPVAELMNLSGQLREAVATLGARLEKTDTCVCCGSGGELDDVRVLAFNKTIAASHKILVDLARLSLEDRHVKVEEIKVAIVLAGVRAALVELLPGMTEEQEIRAREIILGKVRELESTPLLA